MSKENDIKVSIVIVCMNNLKNLYPCLESIRRYTHVSYETFVVAYLFSKENLEKVKADFPWVTFIESNEIRGFSENNNLALRQARGEYCFVVNDDTEMKMPTIDHLVSTIESLPDKVAIVSPKLVDPKGNVQVCGVAPLTLWTSLLEMLHVWNKNTQTKYVNQSGVFKSYNIIGAAFLIRTEIFKSVGWFDEQFFFCPEDIALSTTLNKMGYECYVNSNVSIIHYEGMSGKSISKIVTATKPAARRGTILFFSKGNRLTAYPIALLFTLTTILNIVIHFFKGLLQPRPNTYSILVEGEWNIIKTTFSHNTPKEIFINYFNKARQ